LDRAQSGSLHDEIVRLEDRIERLSERIESCRKLILASRIAITAGTLALAGMLLGAMRFDPTVMAAAVAALLGGIAVWGSNRSTAQEAAEQLTLSDTRRSMLIQEIDLRNVTPLRELPEGPQGHTIH
jgi:hypothetical protein